MAIEKLTKSVVDAAQATGKLAFIWDSRQTGFALQITPAGVKSFVFKYRTKEGDTVRLTIGKYSDVLTVEQARKIAEGLHRDVLNGIDPRGERKKRRDAITVNDLLDDYLKSAAFANKAKSTQDVDRGRIERHVRPLLGTKYADKVTTEDVMKAQKAIAEGKTSGKFKSDKARGLAKVKGGAGTADKAVLILRAAYTWAIKEKILTENPAEPVSVAQPGQRETILETSTEYGSLFETLATMENERRLRPEVADAIRLIALTGMRRGEVAGLLWQYVDTASGKITLPPKAHKTGKKTGKPRIIALPAAALALIVKQPAGNPEDFVFRPAKGAGALNLSRPWQKIREEAKLPEGIGLHGLRHSIGTSLAVAGASPVELMTTLGHKQISTTLRYIHFAEAARSTLAERAAAVALAGMNENKPKAEVLPMKKPRKSKTAT